MNNISELPKEVAAKKVWKPKKNRILVKGFGVVEKKDFDDVHLAACKEHVDANKKVSWASVKQKHFEEVELDSLNK